MMSTVRLAGIAVLMSCGASFSDDVVAHDDVSSPQPDARSDADAILLYEDVSEAMDAAVVAPDRPAIPASDERWCADYDEDGFADPLDCVWILPRETAPDGHIRAHLPWDCHDSDSTTYPGAAELDSTTACMADRDGDGRGHDSPDQSDVVPGIDCDDYDDAVFLGSAEHEPSLCARDGDGDGFGDAKPASVSWWLQAGTDCDDSNAGAYPGAAEKEAKEPGACRSDADGDGYGDVRAEIPGNGWANPPKTGHKTGVDCDDSDPFAYPGSAEKDLAPLACSRDADLDGYGEISPAHPNVFAGNDCDDGDPDVTTCPTWCIDENGDGLGEGECMKVPLGDAPPEGWVEVADHCFDEDSMVTACPLWCEDADGDGLGGYTCTEVLPGMAPPPGTVPNQDDCDDYSWSCICVELGSNYGGYPSDYIVCTSDYDGDGYPGRPKGYGAFGTQGFDCNDYSDCTHQGAAEKEDSWICMQDCDGDGYGDWQGYSAALGGATWQAGGTDCDDASATTFRGAAENEPDNPGECRRDDDQDGFGDATVDPLADGYVQPGTDCDDDDPTVYPTVNAAGVWTCGP